MSLQDWLDRLRGGSGAERTGAGSDDASAPYAPPDRRGLTGNPFMLTALAVAAVAAVVFFVLIAIR